MNEELLAQYTAQAQIMKALGHPIRLCIAKELIRGKMCVNKMNEMIKADISTVSKHLTVLKNAGVLTVERRGNSMYYSLNIPCISEFLECINKCIKNNLSEKIAIIKTKRNKQ